MQSTQVAEATTHCSPAKQPPVASQFTHWFVAVLHWSLGAEQPASLVQSTQVFVAVLHWPFMPEQPASVVQSTQAPLPLHCPAAGGLQLILAAMLTVEAIPFEHDGATQLLGVASSAGSLLSAPDTALTEVPSQTSCWQLPSTPSSPKGAAATGTVSHMPALQAGSPQSVSSPGSVQSPASLQEQEPFKHWKAPPRPQAFVLLLSVGIPAASQPSVVQGLPSSSVGMSASSGAVPGTSPLQAGCWQSLGTFAGSWVGSGIVPGVLPLQMGTLQSCGTSVGRSVGAGFETCSVPSQTFSLQSPST